MYSRVNSLITQAKPEICLTHMSIKKGINKYGYGAIDIILTEFTQINNKKVVVPLNPETLTPEVRRQSLKSTTLVTEKKCVRLKGRTCADGRTHQPYILKEKSYLPLSPPNN